MKKEKNDRTTIYDIARELGIAPSSVSKALNDWPTISEKIKILVKAKAEELNYIHNANAANLRKGTSQTIGVIVPKINTTFFSDMISGIEDVCSGNKHNLIICQSNERYEEEVRAVETLVSKNVDCIIISLSMETKSFDHLQRVIDQHMNLIQIDRVTGSIKSHYVINDNRNAAYGAVKHLIEMGYKKIALLGGPGHLTIYKDRKEGYLQAVGEAGLYIPYSYVLENTLTIERGLQAATELLRNQSPPDAFFAVSDYSALGALKAATALGLKVPEDIGIVGFSNDTFTGLIVPGLSSVDQNCKKLGSDAVRIYFDNILGKARNSRYKKEVVKSALIVRNSSRRI